jgi:hypothetical protein
MELYGWAWSDDTGWIKLNSCADYDSKNEVKIGCDSGPQYGVVINPVTKAISGYAWSSNVGWISFSANSCGAQPELVDIITSGEVTAYRMKGAAQVVSVTQGAWADAKSNGGYNGCVYLDSASQPANPCSIQYGVVFTKSGSNPSGDTIFNGTGAAWSAGGSNSASSLCTNAGSALHAWGGLSWMRMDGFLVRAKLLVVENDPEILTLAVQSWSPECTTMSKVTLSWTTKNATSCTMQKGTTGTPVTVAPNGSAAFDVGRSLGHKFILTCSNTKSIERPTKDIFAGVCTQCTDAADNDADKTIDEGDLSCYQDYNKSKPFRPGNNESGAQLACTNKTNPNILPYCPEPSCQYTNPNAANYCCQSVNPLGPSYCPILCTNKTNPNVQPYCPDTCTNTTNPSVQPYCPVPVCTNTTNPNVQPYCPTCTNKTNPNVQPYCPDTCTNTTNPSVQPYCPIRITTSCPITDPKYPCPITPDCRSTHPYYPTCVYPKDCSSALPSCPVDPKVQCQQTDPLAPNFCCQKTDPTKTATYCRVIRGNPVIKEN